MKKTIAISLLLVFLFNMTGYYFVQQYFLGKAHQKMSVALDKKQYAQNQLIELRVPLNMPYFQNTSFQRQDGQINIKGVTYNYVERKIENGYLVVKCIPNQMSQKIKKSTGDYFADVNGINKSENQKSSSGKTLVKASIDDFEEHAIHSLNLFSAIIFSNYPEYISIHIPVQHQESPFLPPDFTI